MNLAVYWLCVAVLLSCNVLVQSEITTLYPTDPQDWSLFPYGAGDVELPDEDDYLWSAVDIGQNLTFFGTSYNNLRVSIHVQTGSNTFSIKKKYKNLFIHYMFISETQSI